MFVENNVLHVVDYVTRLDAGEVYGKNDLNVVVVTKNLVCVIILILRYVHYMSDGSREDVFVLTTVEVIRDGVKDEQTVVVVEKVLSLLDCVRLHYQNCITKGKIDFNWIMT